MNNEKGEVAVFDSLYTSIDESTKAVIASMFQAPENGSLTIRYVNTLIQMIVDCSQSVLQLP